MRMIIRATLTAVCAASAALAIVPAAQAATHAGQGCRYYYTSWGKGPNGETTGYGDYKEGDTDPEGRVCQNGWWSSPYEDGAY
jgi:hypothetical protein